MVGGFTSSYEAESASTSEAPSPSHSERAACTFYLIQLQRLESPVISLSHSKQRALQGRELEVPCDSKRAAYAFYLITKFGFLFKLWRPSTKRTVPDFARITRDCVVPTLPLN